MFDIGSLELLVIGVLGLLILGPERLPKAAHTIGLVIGRIRRSVSHFQEDLERHVRTEELKAKLRDPTSTFLDDGNEQHNAIHQPAPAQDTANKPEKTQKDSLS